MDKGKLGAMLIDTHALWDLEAFGREVRRRKVLERFYKKLYLLKVRESKDATAAELAYDPKEVLAFVYGRAADGHPIYYRDAVRRFG